MSPPFPNLKLNDGDKLDSRTFPKIIWYYLDSEYVKTASDYGMFFLQLNNNILDY